MNIILNGQIKQMNAGLNISAMTEQFCKDKTPVIAEVNGTIVKKTEWKKSILKDGDIVELVSFVGGG